MTQDKNTVSSKPFSDALNKHGYAFQYSLAEEIGSLSNQGKIPWNPPLPEIPITGNFKSSRIDLLIPHKSGQLMLACECKRINPAFNSWFFAKAVTWKNISDYVECVIAEKICFPALSDYIYET